MDSEISSVITDQRVQIQGKDLLTKEELAERHPALVADCKKLELHKIGHSLNGRYASMLKAKEREQNLQQAGSPKAAQAAVGSLSPKPAYRGPLPYLAPQRPQSVGVSSLPPGQDPFAGLHTLAALAVDRRQPSPSQ